MKSDDFVQFCIRNRKKYIDNFRIELRARTPFDLSQGIFDRKTCPVRTLGCHGIECIGEGYDFHPYRQLGTA